MACRTEPVASMDKDCEVHLDSLESRDRLKIERIRVESMLRMLEGNTHPDDIKKLTQRWLAPILDQIAEHQSVSDEH